MIFVTDAVGSTKFVSPEWHDFTGQHVTEAHGYGWFEKLHPDDRQPTLEFVENAVRWRSDFNLRFRICRRDGEHVWMKAGAVPSFGPPDKTFLGFLGSLAPASCPIKAPHAYGNNDRFVPKPTFLSDASVTMLERVADYLLAAHGLIEVDGGKTALPALREALLRVGIELAQKQGSDTVGSIQ